MVGAIFTDDPRIDQACREIRVHGQSGRYLHTRIGVGGRMDTIQCAVLLAKLERFSWELARRGELGQRYGEHIRASGARAQPLSLRSDRTSAWAQYTVLVDDRDGVQLRLRQLGIPTAVHYPRGIHQQPAYAAHCGAGHFPVSEELSRRVISLPFSADLSDQQLEQVVAGLCQATA